MNLGQGFPNFPAPDFIKQAAIKAIESDANQYPTHSPSFLVSLIQYRYTRSQGHVRLVNAIAKTYSPQFKRELNPLTDIVVTSGATEGNIRLCLQY